MDHDGARPTKGTYRTLRYLKALTVAYVIGLEHRFFPQPLMYEYLYPDDTLPTLVISDVLEALYILIVKQPKSIDYEVDCLFFSFFIMLLYNVDGL